MTIRNAVVGLAVVFGVSLWAWCRPCAKEAQGAEALTVTAADADGGGNHDEAAARYRSNQCRHWRQVAIGH